jgi:hypothetical protein
MMSLRVIVGESQEFRTNKGNIIGCVIMKNNIDTKGGSEEEIKKFDRDLYL